MISTTEKVMVGLEEKVTEALGDAFTTASKAYRLHNAPVELEAADTPAVVIQEGLQRVIGNESHLEMDIVLIPQVAVLSMEMTPAPNMLATLYEVMAVVDNVLLGPLVLGQVHVSIVSNGDRRTNAGEDWAWAEMPLRLTFARLAGEA
jgi:hypothetical protein